MISFLEYEGEELINYAQKLYCELVDSKGDKGIGLKYRGYDKSLIHAVYNALGVYKLFSISSICFFINASWSATLLLLFVD